MASTIREVVSVPTDGTGKAAAVDTAVGHLESGMGAVYEVAFGGTNKDLTSETDLSGRKVWGAYHIFEDSGMTGDHDLTFPAKAIGLFRVRAVNGAGHDISVKIGSSTVVVADGESRLMFADGTTNGLEVIPDRLELLLGVAAPVAGDDTKHLAYNHAGLNYIWSAGGGGGGGGVGGGPWELIANDSPSAQANYDIDWDGSKYAIIRIFILSLTPSIDDRQLRAQIRQSASPVTTTDYHINSISRPSNGTTSQQESAAGTVNYIALTDGNTGWKIGNGTGEGLSGFIDIWDPDNTAVRKFIQGFTVCTSNAGVNIKCEFSAHYEGNTSLVSGLRLFAESGNISANIVVLGLLKSTPDLKVGSYADGTRPTLASGDAGTIIFNTDDGAINVWDGTGWTDAQGTAT